MRPADAFPSAGAPLPYGTARNFTWSAAAVRAAAEAADSPSLLLTSRCAPPPNVNGVRKVGRAPSRQP